VIAAAIQGADKEEAAVFAAELVEMLTSRGRLRREALAVTSRLFALLPTQARSAAACVAHEGLAGAGQALHATDALGRSSQAALAGVTADPALCRHLPQLLVDPEPAVVAAAEQAISEIAAAASSASPPDRTQRERVLIDAIATFDRHRRRSVLVAGLHVLGTPAALAGAGDERADWLADSTHPANLAIRSLLRRERGPEISRAALVWLRVPAQAPACRERLTAPATPDELEAVLRHAHLMAHPARRSALAPHSRPGAAPQQTRAPSIDPDAISRLPLEARRRASRWLDSLPAGASEGGAAIAALATDPEPLVRLSVLAGAGTSADAPGVLDFAYDEDAAIARSAAIRIAGEQARSIGRRHSNAAATALSRLQRSPHPGVRVVAFGAAPDPRGAGARASIRLALRRDRTAALADLRDAILMGDVHARVAWIGACRVLGVADDLERDLCDIAEDALARPARAGGAASPQGPLLAATAVGALGDCRGARSAALLAQSLDAADERVAANAVEALGRRARRPGGGPPANVRLVEFKDAAAHRVRANAALALLRDEAGDSSRAGADIVVRMLADDRTPHRLAGLWLADRAASSGVLAPSSLIEPVVRLRDDADPGVAGRAIRCRRRLGVLAGAREVTA
jgi:hypothetical protein